MKLLISPSIFEKICLLAVKSSSGYCQFMLVGSVMAGRVLWITNGGVDDGVSASTFFSSLYCDR